MPMGAKNSMAVFVAMMDVISKEWNDKASTMQIDRVGSKQIVDDVLLYADTPDKLLKYFRIVLSVLMHWRATVKLAKCKMFFEKTEFVGMDVCKDGNRPAASKYAAISALGSPKVTEDLYMLIGLFGFYRKYIPLFEGKVARWRSLLAKARAPGNDVKITTLWETQDDKLLQELNELILSGPVLARPDFSRRFYLKTDWSKEKMGAVLCQAEDTPKAREAEALETKGGKCKFDTTLSG